MISVFFQSPDGERRFFGDPHEAGPKRPFQRVDERYRRSDHRHPFGLQRGHHDDDLSPRGGGGKKTVEAPHHSSGLIFWIFSRRRLPQIIVVEHDEDHLGYYVGPKTIAMSFPPSS